MKKFSSFFPTALLLAATVMLLLFAEMFSSTKETAPQWINSNILGNVTEETKVSLKDDFHLAVNKDWLATAKIGEGQTRVDVFNARDDEVRNQILSLIKGEEQATYEGQLVQRLFNDYMDIEKRNERGLKP
ncbi:MAG: hypothetical protein RR446_09655, partial [Lachnospiraceae bacterium]